MGFHPGLAGSRSPDPPVQDLGLFGRRQPTNPVGLGGWEPPQPKGETKINVFYRPKASYVKPNKGRKMTEK